MPQPKVVPAVALLEWTRAGSDRDASTLLGMASSRANMWRKTNRMLTLSEAEDMCDRLGIHPIEVWPDWYDHIPIEDSDTECYHVRTWKSETARPSTGP